MKSFATLVGAVVFGLSLSSCTILQEKYAANEKAATAYLAEKKSSPARTNIEGVWYSPDWGIILLNQEPGGRLTGSFSGFYNVDGVVSGRNVYLTLTDDKWTEYTVELVAKGREKLVGNYSENVPFAADDQHEVVLTRIED